MKILALMLLVLPITGCLFAFGNAKTADVEVYNICVLATCYPEDEDENELQ